MKISNSMFTPAFSGSIEPKIIKTNVEKLTAAASTQVKQDIDTFKVKFVQWPELQAILPKISVPENIQFKPAKTPEEAEKFAKECLKISYFRLTDLECANYVNEALAKNYNNCNDKSIIITSCTPSYIHPAAVTGSCLEFSQKIGALMKEAQEKYKGVKSYQTLLNDELSTKCDLTENQLKYLNYFKNDMYDKLPLKEKIGYTLFLRNFGREEIPLTNSHKLALPDGGDFWIINHEIGHVRHKKNIGAKEYENLKKGYIIQENTDEALMQKFKSAEPKWESTKKVSRYATKSPVEFVAEVYACLCNGVKFDDDVLELYAKYGGPQVIFNN